MGRGGWGGGDGEGEMDGGREEEGDIIMHVHVVG